MVDVHFSLGDISSLGPFRLKRSKTCTSLSVFRKPGRRRAPHEELKETHKLTKTKEWPLKKPPLAAPSFSFGLGTCGMKARL